LYLINCMEIEINFGDFNDFYIV